MKKSKLINLFAGPSSGKSTTAAGIFNKLKKMGVNCELVQEFAKDVVWEGNYNTLNNQIYVYAQQHHRLFILKGKVDVIVTDSPPLQGLIYCDWDKTSSSLKQLALDEHNRGDFEVFNFFINRTKNYNEEGRTQTFEEAKQCDKDIINLLVSNKIPFYFVSDDDSILNNIISRINL